MTERSHTKGNEQITNQRRCFAQTLLQPPLSCNPLFAEGLHILLATLLCPSVLLRVTLIKRFSELQCRPNIAAGPLLLFMSLWRSHTVHYCVSVDDTRCYYNQFPSSHSLACESQSCYFCKGAAAYEADHRDRHLILRVGIYVKQSQVSS